MRIDDYRYYGRLSLFSGIICIIIGIVLPFLTTRVEISFLFGFAEFSLLEFLLAGAPYARYARYKIPYLTHGVAVFIFGIALIILSHILLREYRIRSTESKIQ